MEDLPGQRAQHDRRQAGAQQAQVGVLRVQQEEPDRQQAEDDLRAEAVLGDQVAELHLGQREQQAQENQESPSSQMNDEDDDGYQDDGGEYAST